MTFWEFADRQFDRLRVEHVAGAGVFILTSAIFAMIGKNPEIAKDDLFKMLAQAVVVQGLVGLAMAAWFTKKNSGDGVQDVSVKNTSHDPVPTTDEVIPTEGKRP